MWIVTSFKLDFPNNDNIHVFLQVRGGEDRKSRIFRNTMTYNRKQCVALYLEEEYEQLVFECYWTTRLNEKMTNNMYRFSCIHCKKSQEEVRDVKVIQRDKY